MHFQKLINIFLKDYLEKLIATFLPLDSILLMTKPIVPKKPKQKHDHFNKKVNKKDKK